MDPDRLREIIDMAPRKEAASEEALLNYIRDTLKYSVKTGHPYFVNQLFSSLDPYALAGAWVTDSLNPSVYTYEVGCV